MAELDYLNCPGAQLTTSERVFLRDQAARVWRDCGAPTVIVNIGVMWGASIVCLRMGAPTARIYGVDIDFDTYPAKCSGFVPLEGDSTKLHEGFEGPVHLLFVDGDHHYDTVAKDIAGWVPKVPVGGIVIFHDYRPTAHNLKQFPELRGVKRAVDEWAEAALGDDWTKLPCPDSLAAFRRYPDAPS